MAAQRSIVNSDFHANGGFVGLFLRFARSTLPTVTLRCLLTMALLL
jgi:hypothetical protein